MGGSGGRPIQQTALVLLLLLDLRRRLDRHHRPRASKEKSAGQSRWTMPTCGRGVMGNVIECGRFVLRADV